VELGRGEPAYVADPVRGRWLVLGTPDDVLELMDTGADGIVACVADAGATFLAPIFDELTAVVCRSGTPLSHIGIVSREYRVPAVLGTALAEEPRAGEEVEVDCSAEIAVVRRIE